MFTKWVVGRRCLKLSIGLGLMGLLLCCKTFDAPQKGEASLKDSASIQTMTRVGDSFEITCLDGSQQTVTVADFSSKDSREICPGVVFSECGSRVYYSNGRELRATNGSYLYPNGNVAIANDGKAKYLNGQNLNDANNNFFFGNGAPLSGPNLVLMYPEGNLLKNASGAIFYPDNSPLAIATGALRYPGNQRLSDESGNFYYGDERSRRLKTADTFYYKDGSLARSGQNLFRPEDHKQTQGSVIIEESIGDGSIVRGLLRFNITPTLFTYMIDLPKLHPSVAARYESKKNAWNFRYQLPNADFPFVLNFEGKSVNKLLYLKTGYTNSTVIVDFSKTPFSCRLVNTAIQSGEGPR